MVRPGPRRWGTDAYECAHRALLSFEHAQQAPLETRRIADDARHRGQGRRLAEHGVAGPQRRTDPRADRGGDTGTRDRGRARAGLPAKPPRAGAAWRADEPDGRGRPRLQRPVLRERDRAARGRGDGQRLQRGPRPCPRPARRVDPAERGPRDPPHRRDHPARRHAGPAAPARRPASVGGPGRRPVARREPARVPDDGCR